MRVRIVLLVGATSSLVLVAFLVPLAILVRSSTIDRALGAAVVQAQALAPLVATDSDERLSAAVADANAQGTRSVTVFLPDGRIVGAPAPESAAVATGRTGRSVTTVVSGGREVVVAVEGRPDGTAVIRSFVPEQELTAGVTGAWAVLALLGFGLLVVSLLVADTLARLLTRSLTDVADVAVRLADGALGARAGDAGPAEVRQVSAGLNLLAGRIIELLAQERATAADLSHRLRTPLTVLRIDLDLVDDGSTRERLVTDLDNVDRTLNEVIRETERYRRTALAISTDAATVVRERVQFWSVLAEEQARPVSVHVDPIAGPVPVGVPADELAACLDAMIGNVFAHTPAGTPFAVRLSMVADHGALLVVSDGGTGMPDPAALRRGSSDRGSTGLGLDIVSRMARQSGGSIHIGRSPTGGAEVTVELGPPDAPVIRSHRRRQDERRSGRLSET